MSKIVLRLLGLPFCLSLADDTLKPWMYHSYRQGLIQNNDCKWLVMIY